MDNELRIKANNVIEILFSTMTEEESMCKGCEHLRWDAPYYAHCSDLKLHWECRSSNEATRPFECLLGSCKCTSQ